MREWFVNQFGEIKSFSGSEVNILIPQVLYGNEVTKIGDLAFSPLKAKIKEGTRESRKRIKSIIIQDGIKSIGDSAFADCSALERVEIPATVTYIGQKAFYKCTSLKEINIHGNPMISFDAFSHCSSLKSFYFPAKRGNTFWAEPNSPSYNFNERANGTPIRGFEGCSSLEHVQLPEELYTISFGTFWNCESLKRIWIPSSVKVIENLAFPQTKLHIFAPAGSYAEQYAKENGYPFVPCDRETFLYEHSHQK